MDQRWTECREPWERVRWAREQEFETAEAAAKRLGMKPGTYRAYERAPTASKATILTHQRAAQFAKAFNVNYEWLLEGRRTPMAKAASGPQERVLAIMEGKPEAEQEAIADAIERLMGRPA